jgi:hypothetical protein
MQADVAPFPSWRIVTNGSVAGVAQNGDAIFFGGSFTKVGQGVVPFDGFLDPLTLGLTADPGCAYDGETLLAAAADGAVTLIDRGPQVFGSRLRDGAGPFVVGGDVQYVRVGADCRFDRPFAVRLPFGASLIGPAVRVGDRVYSVAAPPAPFPSWPSPQYIVALDARTGDLLQAWPAPAVGPLPPSDLRVAGTGPAGQVAVAYRGPGGLTGGYFVPSDGTIRPVRVIAPTASWQVTLLADRVLILWPALEHCGAVNQLEMFDVATWQTPPEWVRVCTDTLTSVATSPAHSRLVLGGRNLRVAGAAVGLLAAFDLNSGAPDASWNVPDWLNADRYDPHQIAIAGQRLFVHGNFPDEAPRDTLAALDLMTGALDPWEFPFVSTRLERVGGILHVGRIESSRRIARRHLAAVHTTTGELLPWEPGALLPPSEWSPVTALTVAEPFVYAATSHRVRRFDIGSGAPDPVWQLLTGSYQGGFGVTQLSAGADVIYAAGSFEIARESEAGAFQPRNGAAVRLSGGLTDWNPPFTPTCLRGTRPPTPYSCIAGLAVTPDHVFLHGRLMSGLSQPPRSLAAVTTTTGALDAAVPSIDTFGFTVANDVLYASVSLGGQLRAVRVDPGLRAAVLPMVVPHPAAHLAAKNGRLYLGYELDDTTGAPTGNRKYWHHPVVAERGVLDIEATGMAASIGFHPDLLATPPGAPTALTHLSRGAQVTLSWTRAATDLQPMVPAPPGGGTAATSYLVTAALTPGGPSIAELDTQSIATTATVAAPRGVYFVRVRAKNAVGVSEPSNEIRVDARPAAPNPPVGPLATVIGQAVRIQWQGAGEGWPASSYVLEAGSRPGAANLATADVSGLEFRAAGVPPGRYYVRVRARNAHGTSAAGEEVIVDVP